MPIALTTYSPHPNANSFQRTDAQKDLVVPTAAKLAMLPTSVEPLEDDSESLASKHPSLAPSLISNPVRVEIPHAHRSVSIADLGEKFSTLSSSISGMWNDRKGMNQKFNKVHTKLHGLGVGLRNIERSKSEMHTAIKHSKRLDKQLGGRPKPPRIRHAPSSVLGISIPAAPDREHVPRIYRGLSSAALALIQPKQSATDTVLSPHDEGDNHYDGGFLSANSDTEDDDKDVEWFDVADPAISIPRMLTTELNNF